MLQCLYEAFLFYSISIDLLFTRVNWIRLVTESWRIEQPFYYSLYNTKGCLCLGCLCLGCLRSSARDSHQTVRYCSIDEFLIISLDFLAIPYHFIATQLFFRCIAMQLLPLHPFSFQYRNKNHVVHKVREMKLIFIVRALHARLFLATYFSRRKTFQSFSFFLTLFSTSNRCYNVTVHHSPSTT